MSPNETLRAFGERLAAGDAEAAAALFTPDALYEEPPVRFEGRAAIQGFIVDFNERHHGAQFTVLRALASPDETLAAAEWRWSYTRDVDGEPRVYDGQCFITLHDGLIASWRGFSALMR